MCIMVCVRNFVRLEGMIYILCIYAFPMNISKYMWHKISHHLQGAFSTTEIIQMTISKKTKKEKWNELYKMRLYRLIIHLAIKNTSCKKGRNLFFCRFIELLHTTMYKCIVDKLKRKLLPSQIIITRY